MNDMLAKGRSLQGERHNLAKLTVEAIEDIRSSSASGKELARKYGCTYRNVMYVRKNTTWRHV
jgi:hypothetical protein